jgi:hypothetical protein
MKLKVLSPYAQARQKRREIAAREGAKALAYYKAEAVAVRKNMERLRALRLAKEAEETEAVRATASVKARRS